jgi:hypothetical protein
MRKVERAELLDYQTYGDRRDQIRARVMELKQPRRVHAGDVLTFLFENAETVKYQIQEMMRAERIAREADIQHELDTYNALLGSDGELGCCLLIEIDDKAQRDELLRAWRQLPQHLYMRFADGSRQAATYDAAQMDDERLSSVQYLKFTVAGRDPVAVGSDLPGLQVEATFTDEQKQALAADLAS